MKVRVPARGRGRPAKRSTVKTEAVDLNAEEHKDSTTEPRGAKRKLDNSKKDVTVAVVRSPKQRAAKEARVEPVPVRSPRQRPSREATAAASKGMSLPLHDEFSQIIQSAKTVAPVRGTKRLSALKKAASPRELNVWLEPMSPVARNTTTFDAAPSPATPPLPRMPLLEDGMTVKDKHDKSPESPPMQGLESPQAEESDSFQYVTQQVVTSRDESPSEGLADTSVKDTSLTVSENGLDLDNLIDELFVKNTSSICSQDSKGKQLIGPLAGQASMDMFLDCEDLDQNTSTIKVGEDESEDHNAEGSMCVENHHPLDNADKVKSHEECSSIIKVSSHEILPSSPQELIPSSPVVPVGDAQETSASDILKEIVPTDKEDTVQEAEVTPGHHETGTVINGSVSPISAQTSANDEAFHEDLPLSHSQYLDIDAKCGAATSERPIEPILLYSQRETHQNSSNNSSLPQQQGHQDIGFVVPPPPQMGWTQKALECRRRLQMVTQELSRLNAMVVRARRTIWPSQPSTQIPQQPRTSNAPQFHHVSSAQPSYHAILTDILPQDPDWNIN